MAKRAVFLDRDGVLVADEGLLTRPEDIRLLPGAARALRRLHEAGYALVVVSNQAVVARGLLDEPGVRALQAEVERRLQTEGAPPLDGFYACPHHPKATLEAFRRDCDCRKPRPGLLLQAAAELDLDLSGSFMVGDRPTDLLAGERAGCRTLWTQTGQHGAPLIETTESLEALPRADHVCADLTEAADWILTPPKAMVLCAGKGTRLGGLTEDLPKPMLDIHGHPILDRILSNLAAHGFRDVVLNLHHRPEAIRAFVGDGARWGLRLHLVEESELLGTAGSVRHAAHLLGGPGPILVHYGDVVTDQDLGAMMAFHREKRALATLLLHPRPHSNSVVVLDEKQGVRRLLERPTEEERRGVTSPWVNSGVYLLDPAVLALLPEGPSDFPKQVFPPLLSSGRVFGFPLTGYRCAIDSPERLAQAREDLRDRPWPGLA